MSISMSMSSSPSPFAFPGLDLDEPIDGSLNLDHTSFSQTDSSASSVIGDDAGMTHTRSSSSFPSDLSGSGPPFDPAMFPLDTPTGTEHKIDSSPYSSLTSPFFSSVGTLNTVPLTPWPYPYGQPPTAPLSSHNSTPLHSSSFRDHTTDPWSAIQPISASLPPVPPNTASLPHFDPAPNQTTLSPLFAGFSTELPISISTSEPHTGPTRGWAYSHTPLATRKRSSTMLSVPLSSTGSSLSPATPNSGYSVYSTQSMGYGTYPYPSPRSSVSSTSFGALGMGMGMSGGGMGGMGGGGFGGGGMRSSIPFGGLGMTSGTQTPVKRVFHPNPSPMGSGLFSPNGMEMNNPAEEGYESAIDSGMGNVGLGSGLGMDMGLGYGTAGFGGAMGMGWRGGGGMMGESKPPRFKPTKEQLEILISAYEENK